MPLLADDYAKLATATERMAEDLDDDPVSQARLLAFAKELRDEEERCRRREERVLKS